jgi:hypothetical protein
MNADSGVHPAFSPVRANGRPWRLTMSKKTLFRRVLDSMVEGRRRQAERFIEEYLKDRRDDTTPRG